MSANLRIGSLRACRKVPDRSLAIPGARLLQSKLCLDGGRLIKRGFELADVEVGDDELAVHKGGGLGLAAVLHHLLHEGFVAAHFAGFEADVICAEEAEGFCAPWAARFYVKDRCIHCDGR